MADNNLQGFRQTYQETGKLSSGGGPEDKTLDAGPSGSKRSNNAVKGKPARSSKVGPDKNLKDIGGGNFYWFKGGNLHNLALVRLWRTLYQKL